MEALSLHTSAPALNWEYKTSCSFFVEAKRVTPRVKHIDIPVCFLQEQFDNGLFIPKYEKYSIIPADMYTKPFPGPIIGRSTKWMTGLRFYPTSDIEHYQLIILHNFVVN